MAACWAPDGIEERRRAGRGARGPEGVRAYFGELFEAIPDLVVKLDELVVEGDRAAVLMARRRHVRGGAASYQGIAPTGGRVALSGIDLTVVA